MTAALKCRTLASCPLLFQVLRSAQAGGPHCSGGEAVALHLQSHKAPESPKAWHLLPFCNPLSWPYWGQRRDGTLLRWLPGDRQVLSWGCPPFP